MLLVEVRRLEAVRVEREPVTAASLCLPFCGGEEPRPIAVMTEILAHPEGQHLADAAPGPAVEPGRDGAVAVADEDGQPLAVVEAGLLGVVLVELVVEEPDVRGARLALGGGNGQVHCVAPARC